MCLAVPGRVKSLSGTTATVDFGGVERTVQTSLTPGIAAGDYVLVHAGFAIHRLDPEEAAEVLSLLEEVLPWSGR